MPAHPASDPARLSKVHAREVQALRAEADALRARVAELEALASTDPLTGLWNRSSIELILRAELSRERNGSSTSVAIVGIDGMEAINHASGICAGDAALVGVASCIRHCARSFDFVGRDQGDRFILVLSNCACAPASAACERIRRFIAKHSFPAGPGPVRCTVSVGLATSISGPSSAERLCAAAERQLYLAKSSGRNRVSSDATLY